MDDFQNLGRRQGVRLRNTKDGGPVGTRGCSFRLGEWCWCGAIRPRTLHEADLMEVLGKTVRPAPAQAPCADPARNMTGSH